MTPAICLATTLTCVILWVVFSIFLENARHDWTETLWAILSLASFAGVVISILLGVWLWAVG